ncbi:MAG: hypothetical protein ACYTDW_20895 [Planctomycetota bacterium]|jgi:hypothetical protein
MALNAQERAFVQRVQSNANKLADEIATAIELQAVYFDRDYDSGGANVSRRHNWRRMSPWRSK